MIHLSIGIIVLNQLKFKKEPATFYKAISLFLKKSIIYFTQHCSVLCMKINEIMWKLDIRDSMKIRILIGGNSCWENNSCNSVRHTISQVMKGNELLTKYSRINYFEKVNVLKYDYKRDKT